MFSGRNYVSRILNPFQQVNQSVGQQVKNSFPPFLLPRRLHSRMSIFPLTERNISFASLQHMHIRHGDTAEHRPGDAEETLVGSAEEQVLIWAQTGFLLVGRTVDCPIEMAGKTPDG